MRISTKGEYGIRAMIELSCRHGQGYIQSSEIAGVREIPENYLYQLLITLRKAGLIRSRRGPQGGHMLARPPERISLVEVIVALEGPLDPVACVQEGITDMCPFCECCAVRDVWLEIASVTEAILRRTTFADLVLAEARKRETPAVAESAS
ncbi:MAG: Rrf2 family transcriptional regulator [Chloroflexi bacterium]|nr:Rrf2 family transcriptional regulator [Chloroflexota bacterium]